MACFDRASGASRRQRVRRKKSSHRGRQSPRQAQVRNSSEHRDQISVDISSIPLPPCKCTTPEKNPSQSKTPVSLCAVNEPLHPARVPNEKSHDHPNPKLAKTQTTMLSCAHHGGD